MVELTKFVDICPVCKQGVPKVDMVYQKGRVFHTQCYMTHGSQYPTPDSEFTTLNARTRIDLVQLKNLKVRQEQEKLTKPKKSKAQKKKPSKKKLVKAKPKKKSKAKKSKPKKSKRR